QTGLLDHAAGFRDTLERYGLRANGLAKSDAVFDALAHCFQCPFRHANLAHAMVDTARAKPSLRDLEAAAFAEQDMIRRNAYVLELDFGMAMRRIVIAKDAEGALHIDAGRIHRHDDHRLLVVERCGLVGFT